MSFKQGLHDKKEEQHQEEIERSDEDETCSDSKNKIILEDSSQIAPKKAKPHALQLVVL